MDNLPVPILHKIIIQLELCDIQKICLVSKNFCEKTWNNKYFWKRLIEYKYPIIHELDWIKVGKKIMKLENLKNNKLKFSFNPPRYEYFFNHTKPLIDHLYCSERPILSRLMMLSNQNIFDNADTTRETFRMWGKYGHRYFALTNIGDRDYIHVFSSTDFTHSKDFELFKYELLELIYYVDPCYYTINQPKGLQIQYTNNYSKLDEYFHTAGTDIKFYKFLQPVILSHKWINYELISKDVNIKAIKKFISIYCDDDCIDDDKVEIEGYYYGIQFYLVIQGSISIKLPDFIIKDKSYLIIDEIKYLLENYV